MQDLNDKATGQTLTATEWNQLPSEIQNVIEALGITLSNADLNQLGKAIAGYVANGTFYADSGAANAYVLTAIGSKQSPTAYTNGMQIAFVPGNMNTGASTVNVASLGVKDLRDALGGVLSDSALSTAVPRVFEYSTTAGHFRMTSGEPVTRTAPYTVTHNLASDADYTLTAVQEQYGRIKITDTGMLLTTTRSIICSKAIRQYTVLNSTAQSLSFKTAAGTGVTVGSGVTADVYCDGTNVISDIPTLIVGHGECRLEYVSSTSIKLSRYNGRYLNINNAYETIPSAGVTLANTGLTAATLYYIYAYMNAGVMTLEASATGHSTDATTGVEIKTGDATRTLVGMAYMGAGTPGTFVDSATQRYTRSWFNRAATTGLSAFSAARTTNSTTAVELNTEIRNAYVCWTDDTVLSEANGMVENSSVAATYTYIGIDGSVVDGHIGTADTVYKFPFGIMTLSRGLSEGLHYSTLMGKVVGGTTTWTGAASAPDRTTLRTTIWR